MPRVTILFLLVFSHNAFASVSLNELKSLIDSGQTRLAYEYAAKEVTTYEGDPAFDYYYGMAAIDTGHASQGIFALERVLQSQPGNHAARLELARGYFILEEYARARKEFETVLEFEPPEDVSERIYVYLDVIRLQEGRYTTIQTAFVEIGFGSDSNINSGPDILAYTIGEITVPLDEASQEQDDTFSEITLNYGIDTPIAVGTSYHATVKGNVRSNSDSSEFDTAIYAFNTGFQFRHAQDAYNIDITGQQFNLDGSEYRILYGLNTNWRRRLSQQSTLEAFLQFAQQEFDGQKTRDVDTTSLGISYSKRLATARSPVLFSSLFIAQDKPKLDTDTAKQTAERDYYGARIGAILITSQKTSTQLSVTYQTSEYGLAETATGQVRDDDFLDTSLDFTWLVDRHWTVFAKANVTENSSNNTLYEYNRTLFSLNLRYSMK